IRQQQQQLASPTRPGQIQLLTTGDAELFAQLAWQLIGFEGDVGTAVWEDPHHLNPRPPFGGQEDELRLL
ncbi:MAG: hypothetical protein GY796_04965, partial [Chloroflexi bacterium]|nr:hypothetical protein [Chloroflexota bacterium]